LLVPREGCLFCTLYAEGAHVLETDGFVAIRDINPQTPVHLLVIPERHVDSLHDVGEFDAAESKRMLEFIAEAAEAAGLTDYRVITNAGAGAGQSIFHLHWHILGGSDRLSEKLL
jgi:histidine triad (HIT) family protein